MNSIRPVALTLMTLLAGCAGKDPNAPSKELFQTVILEGPAATQAVCASFSTGLQELPKEIRPYEAESPRFERFRTLQKFGYVSVTPVQIANPLGGGMTDGLRVALTPAGTEAFGHEYDQRRCYGQWTAQTVTDFTAPAEGGGVRTSRVTVSGAQAYTGWATKPELRTLLGVPDLPATAQRTVTLVLKDSGWSASGVDQ